MPDRRDRNRRAPRWNSLVAAAQVMTAPNTSLKASIGKQQAWQEDAWRYYDEIGELRFGSSWIANAMSRVNLVAATAPSGPGDEPTPVDLDDPTFDAVDRRAAEIVATMAGGVATQGQILAAMGLHLTIAGLCWLVIEPDPDDPFSDTHTMWEVYSSDEVKSSPGTGEILIRSSEREWRTVHPDGIVVKVWRRHPRRSWEPDAPTHGVLGVLREIHLLTMHIQATAQSRLAGAGLLALPSEAVFPPGQGPQTSQSVDPDDENITAPEDTFVDTLVEAMTVPIVDRGSAAAVVPLVVKIPGEHVDKIRHISFATPFDDRVLELLDGAIKRLALGMDIPPEILTGTGGMNHWPVAEWTEIFTRRGWLKWHEIRVGEDEAWTVNHATGLGGWQPIIDVPHQTVENHPMVQIDRKLVKATSTLDHRWPVVRNGERIWTTGEGLQPDDRIVGAAPAHDLPTVEKFSDDFVALIAWYSADGTLTKRNDQPGQIRIGKSWKKNPAKVARLRAHLEAVFGPASDSMPIGSAPAFRVEHQERGMEMFVLNAAARDMILNVVPGYDKAIPAWFVESLTRSQLDVFLSAWIESDGDGRATVKQSEIERLRAVELAAILAGRNVSWRTETDRRGAFGDGPLYCLRISDSERATAPKVGPTNVVDYSGEIFCLVTPPNASWLARDAGRTFFTGNSAWQVAEESITLHIEPLSEVVVHAMTVGYLRPALLAEGFSEAEVARVMVWYDTTDLTTRPDRSAGAREAYDRNELSGAALLREFGLSVDDAPTPEEKREKVLLSIVRGAPTLAPALLAELGYLAAAPVPVKPAPVAPVAIEIGPDTPAAAPAERTMPDTAPAADLGVPEVASVASDALIAACHVIVHRALEKAGARLRSAAGKNVQGGAAAIACPDPTRLHVDLDATAYSDLGALLDGAWSLVPEIAARCGVDSEALIETLDAYSRALLAAGQEHSHDRLAQALGHPAGD